MRPGPARQRQVELLKMIERWGSLRAGEAAARLGVTVRTIQRDLDQLAEQHRLQRTHGGALALVGDDPQSTLPHLRLGFLVPSRRRFFTDVRDGATTAARQLGCTLIEGEYSYRKADESVMLTRMLGLQLDGLLISPTWDDPGWRRLEGTSMPTVIIERPRRPYWILDLPIDRPIAPAPSVDHIHTDHGLGALLALDHLFGAGHRQVTVLIESTASAGSLAQAVDDARQALSPARWGPVDLVELGRGDDALRRRDQVLFGDGGRPRTTALLIHNDTLAMDTLRTLRTRGVDVPGQVSLMSYDDTWPAHELHAHHEQMTAIAQRRRWMGHRAVEMVVERLRGRGRRGYDTDPPQHLAVPPELKVRNTTGPPPRAAE